MTQGSVLNADCLISTLSLSPLLANECAFVRPQRPPLLLEEDISKIVLVQLIIQFYHLFSIIAFMIILTSCCMQAATQLRSIIIAIIISFQYNHVRNHTALHLTQ